MLSFHLDENRPAARLRDFELNGTKKFIGRCFTSGSRLQIPDPRLPPNNFDVCIRQYFSRSGLLNEYTDIDRSDAHGIRRCEDANLITILCFR